MPNHTTAQDVEAVLGLDKRTRHRKLLWWLLTVIVLALLGAGAYYYVQANDKKPLQFRTAEATRGNLTVRVSATGTLQPVNQVDVGTEVSGTIKSVSVDFNDRVKKDQILAKLDTDQLRARSRQSEAALALAQARVQDAEASLLEARSRLARVRELAKQNLASNEEVDVANATFARAEAAVASSKAQVTQARAQLDVDRGNLAKAEIRSPIDGIVLKRQIEPGQTVAASLQTPVLFTLAENLTQMELHVAVDEADVGQVMEGQQATFTVDAYPERTFPARITQVRYAPETVEGVVTYGTVLEVDNSELLLRPGMTATADIVVKKLNDVLLVPNTALRFSPPVTGTQKAESRGLVASLMGRRPPGNNDQRRKDVSKGARQKVWILVANEPQSLDIVTGATDGQVTEVLEGDIKPGLTLLIDTVTQRGKR